MQLELPTSMRNLAKPLWTFVFQTGVCLILLSSVCRGEVRTTPAPAGEPISLDFTVKANQNQVAVYPAKISGLSAEERVPFDLVHFTNVTQTSFASFDLKGSAQVVVTCRQRVQSARVLPFSRGIKPIVSGSRITFNITEPGPLVIEVNGDSIHSLQLFVDPWENSVPNPKDPKVLYFGPGRHEVENLTVGSGQTVYVAAGAVLYCKEAVQTQPGSIFNLEGDHISFRGRGIIDGSLCPPERQSLISVKGTNVLVEGIVLRDSSHWTLPVFDSNHVKVENVKILGYRANSDGIDICNSQDVTVSNCYLRTFDDELVIKSQNKGGQSSSNITVKNCVISNEFAHALSIGAELRENVENILFTDCDIIHDKGREWLLRVYNCDEAHVKNVTFQNIRIEEARRFISLWIGHAVWSATPEFGHIDNVVFRNIEAVTPQVPGPWIDLEGIDAEHMVRDVQFDNVRVNGKWLKPGDITKNLFVGGVTGGP